MRHAVIMAGGVGTRLWPMSRQAAPKQFQKLVGDRTLLQQTFDRIVPVVARENIWVTTGQDYVSLTQEQLPEVNPQHIIAEPCGRNTAAATGLALLNVLRADPEAVLFGLLPADHYVGNPTEFAKVTRALLEFIESHPEYVGTIGCYPTEPNTGYGYIEKGQVLSRQDGREVLSVRSFHEKPNQPTARRWLDSGRYLWNGGYYLFNGANMWQNFERLAPATAKKLQSYFSTGAASTYESIRTEPIDTAVTEKLDKLAVIAADMEWSDIGNWATLHQILAEKGENGQVVVGNHIGNGSQNTLVMGGSKLIATVGLKDVVVIDTDDVVLVCHKDSVQDVKKIVEQLEHQGRQDLL